QRRVRRKRLGPDGPALRFDVRWTGRTKRLGVVGGDRVHERVGRLRTSAGAERAAPALDERPRPRLTERHVAVRQQLLRIAQPLRERATRLLTRNDRALLGDPREDGGDHHRPEARAEAVLVHTDSEPEGTGHGPSWHEAEGASPPSSPVPVPVLVV